MKICNKMFAECLGTFVLVLGGSLRTLAGQTSISLSTKTNNYKNDEVRVY